MDCKKRMKEKFASFDQANEALGESESKLPVDVFKQIVETRKMNEFLISGKVKVGTGTGKEAKGADKKGVKRQGTDDPSATGSSEVTYYELVNFMNKLQRDTFGFTISNPQPFRQVMRAHKWLIFEENYMKSFGLKNYEVNLNSNIDKAEYVAEGGVIRSIFCRVQEDSGTRGVPDDLCPRRTSGGNHVADRPRRDRQRGGESGGTDWGPGWEGKYRLGHSPSTSKARRPQGQACPITDRGAQDPSSQAHRHQRGRPQDDSHGRGGINRC